MTDKTLIDATNAGTELIALIAVILDIRSVCRDKVVHGFNVWMKLWWLAYGMWQAYIAWYVKLPITAVLIFIWIPVYTLNTIQVFYYHLRQRTAQR